MTVTPTLAAAAAAPEVVVAVMAKVEEKKSPIQKQIRAETQHVVEHGKDFMVDSGMGSVSDKKPPADVTA